MHDNEYCYEDDHEQHTFEAFAADHEEFSKRFPLSEAAWQEAYDRVLAGGTTVCEVYSRQDVYTLDYVKGSTRLGYISEDREGRIWQCTDSDDKRIELDPSRGGKGAYYWQA